MDGEHVEVRSRGCRRGRGGWGDAATDVGGQTVVLARPELVDVLVPPGSARGIRWPGGRAGDGSRRSRPAPDGWLVDHRLIPRRSSPRSPQRLRAAVDLVGRADDGPAAAGAPASACTCWDLAAVHRVLYGGHRDDPAAVWAGCHESRASGRPSRREVTLLDFDVAELEGSEFSGPVRPDGHLNPDWAERDWADRDWAERSRGTREAADRQLAARVRPGRRLALAVQMRQEQALRALPDPQGGIPGAAARRRHRVRRVGRRAARRRARARRDARRPRRRRGDDRGLRRSRGRPPSDDGRDRANGRDAAVLAHFPVGVSCDLRNPAQVRDLLRRVGFDYPDTRSWRLEPFRPSHQASPRCSTGARPNASRRPTATAGSTGTWARDGRLRGAWGAADAAAGTDDGTGRPAQPSRRLAGRGRGRAGSPAGTRRPRSDRAAGARRGVRRRGAHRGHAGRRPVRTGGRQLHCDRPTAKVAVLAAMYGQTSGAAGEALERMEAPYPRRSAISVGAEQAGIRRPRRPYVRRPADQAGWRGGGQPSTTVPTSRRHRRAPGPATGADGARQVRAERGHPGCGGGTVQGVGRERPDRLAPDAPARSCCVCTTSSSSTYPPTGPRARPTCWSASSGRRRRCGPRAVAYGSSPISPSYAVGLTPRGDDPRCHTGTVGYVSILEVPS